MVGVGTEVLRGFGVVLLLAGFLVIGPRIGSLILTHEWDGEVRGLKEVPPQDRPNVLRLVLIEPQG